MNPYDRFILPYLIDWVCALPQLGREREHIVPQADGKVLEVGIGSGRNLAHYRRERVAMLTGIDPGALRRRTEKRARKARIPLELLPLSAEAIPAEAESFDTVISTFTLCSIPQIDRALAEMRRVLKPGGRFLYLEHGAAPDPGVRRWQNRLTPLWRPLAGGCRLNREIPKLIRDAGFEILEQHSRYLQGPRILGYIYRGEARTVSAPGDPAATSGTTD